MQDLSAILENGFAAIAAAPDLKSLESVRVEFLGKTGRITQLLKTLGTLSPSARPQFGQKVNEAKEAFTDALNTKKQILEQAVLELELKHAQLDVTLPGRGMEQGRAHPISQTLSRISEWFSHLGFTIEEGPEIEDEFYNFEALNMPSHHPARAMHDTFYFPDGRLLRTHTSPVQIRTLRSQSPPLAIIVSTPLAARTSIALSNAGCDSAWVSMPR